MSAHTGLDMPQQQSHWDGCYRTHHECAIAEVERLRSDLAATRMRVAELEGERDIWNKECDRREDDRIKAEQRTDFARQRAERAESDLAAARADAERYRWLRNKHEYNANAANIVQEVSGEGWDAAIDAALAGEKK